MTTEEKAKVGPGCVSYGPLHVFFIGNLSERCLGSSLRRSAVGFHFIIFFFFFGFSR